MFSEEKLQILVEQSRAGCRASFDELAVQFEPTVFAIVLQRLRNRSEARELTQEVLLQTWRKLPQLREPERFAGWLKQIAVRMSINRAVRKPHETVQSEEMLSTASADRTTPLDGLLQRERASQVSDGLNRLRDLDRKTLIAFYFEGHSLKQMSDEFDSPIGTIKRRLHTARNRLRDELLNM